MPNELAEVVRDRDGRPVRQSANLAGIRRHVAEGLRHGRNLVKVLAVGELSGGEGKLLILFENGDSYETNFASYSVLKGWVRRWRNAWGAPLRVNGVDAGLLTGKTPELAD